ncbi:hypothetical protein L596_018835 [Steinernema carpocapsae]|uniref:Uncharacterized protein n=1 Tax=Steinernema carpocapsae TaxID=34508 RepID=A0A4U5N618_STECR|nr:hypothetical protein L596_018835 [Steinernema carpocapsae]
MSLLQIRNPPPSSETANRHFLAPSGPGARLSSLQWLFNTRLFGAFADKKSLVFDSFPHKSRIFLTSTSITMTRVSQRRRRP